jgi:hypothetical protein
MNPRSVPAMSPVFDGASGVVLLTLSVGLGAYIRQVYVGATEVYDELYCGDAERLWPAGAAYTKDRLGNLLYVQYWLRIVTRLMFAFIVGVSIRVLISAVDEITPVAPVWLLRWYDLALISYLTVAFVMMWRTHHVGSAVEHQCLEDMRLFDQPALFCPSGKILCDFFRASADFPAQIAATSLHENASFAITILQF